MFGAAVLAGLPDLAAGVAMTIALTLAGSAVSAAFALALVVLRLGGGRIAATLVGLYVSFMRGTPALVQLFLVFFGLPRLGLGGHPFAAASVAIGLNSAAYVSEILRAAVQAVPAGQREASAAIGLSPRRYWRRILLPQALRLALPGLTNEATLLLKTTPLASVVAVSELTFSGQMMIARSYRAGETLAVVALGYILLSMLMTRASAAIERRLSAER